MTSLRWDAISGVIDWIGPSRSVELNLSLRREGKVFRDEFEFSHIGSVRTLDGCSLTIMVTESTKQRLKIGNAYRFFGFWSEWIDSAFYVLTADLIYEGRKEPAITWRSTVDALPEEGNEVLLWVVDDQGNPSGVVNGYREGDQWFFFHDRLGVRPVRSPYRVSFWSEIGEPTLREVATVN